MSQLTERDRQRRKDAAAHLAAGGLMVGGAAATQDAIARGTKMKSMPAVAMDIKRRGKIKTKHMHNIAGWAGTRGVMAAGIPLAAVGAKNMIAAKPKDVGRLDVKDDVVRPAVDRTTALDTDRSRRRRVPAKAKAAEWGTVAAGSAGGAMAGRLLAARALKGGGPKRLAAVGLGTAAGAVTGSLASAPVGRRAVQRATRGEYTYTTEEGTHRVRKSEPGAIKELPRAEQKQLIQRKKKQSKYSLTSAALGATALGLKAPALSRVVARQYKKPPRALKNFAAQAPKYDAAATNVGIASLGVGSLGSLNFARIQRAETKADQRAISKMGEVDADKYLDSSKGKKLPYGAQRTLQDVDDYYRLVHGGRSKKERVEHHMVSSIEPEKARARQARVAREIGSRRTIERSVNLQNAIRHSYAGGPKDPSDYEFAVADELGRRRKAGLPKARYVRSKTELKTLKARQKLVAAHRAAGTRIPERQPSLADEKDQGHYDLGPKFYEKNPHPQRGNPYKSAQGKQHDYDLAKALVPRFSVRPPRFAGVKPSGIRMVRTATGLRPIAYRGSVG